MTDFNDNRTYDKNLHPHKFPVAFIQGDLSNGLYQSIDITMLSPLSCILPYAFKNCNSLLSIEVPESIMFIGDGAFENCSALQTVVIRAHADVKFGKDVFKNCSALSTIILTKNNSQALEQYYGLSST